MPADRSRFMDCEAAKMKIGAQSCFVFRTSARQSPENARE